MFDPHFCVLVVLRILMLLEWLVILGHWGRRAPVLRLTASHIALTYQRASWHVFSSPLLVGPRPTLLPANGSRGSHERSWRESHSGRVLPIIATRGHLQLFIQAIRHGVTVLRRPDSGPLSTAIRKFPTHPPFFFSFRFGSQFRRGTEVNKGNTLYCQSCIFVSSLPSGGQYSASNTALHLQGCLLICTLANW